jgi:hypothetical protein
MAPVYTSDYLDRNQSPWSNALYVDGGDPENAVGGDLGFSGSYYTIVSGSPQSLSGTIFNIFYYNLGEGDNISFAELNFNVTAVPAEVTLFIYPMRERWASGDPPDLLIGGPDQYMVDRSIRVEHTFFAGESGNFSIGMTELFAKSQYHRTNGILVYTDGGQIDLQYPDGYPTVNVEIMGD